ncbi:hypothetical protein RsTz2092_11680 [Deferribacterales bacterium RsTz2092]|nr:hypothetical protein AGMMS49941_10000 [Deferribacterales bacterium]
MLVEVEPIYLQELSRKSVRINASIPAWLEIAAEKSGVNVSQTLQIALKAELDYAN